MPIFERSDVFDVLADVGRFQELLRDYYEEFFTPLRLVPSISRARLIDTYNFWVRDLRRVSHMELDDRDPDHYKRAGYLAYWLRRCAPITMLIEECQRYTSRRALL